jgi:endoglucanase
MRPTIRLLFLLAITAVLWNCLRDNIVATDPVPRPVTPKDSTPPHSITPFPSAEVMNARIGSGVNLGNALDAEKYEGYWGVTLKAEYFKWIADSGFNSVRIPVRWSAHALTEAPYTIDSIFMKRVVWAVDQALQNKLHVILDMHHYAEIMADPAAEKTRFLALWKQIAIRFADYPPDLMLEVLNEPNTKIDAETWNAYLALAIDTIRKVDSNRTLVVGTANWGGLSGLNQLRLPPDTNLIVTVHYYDPHAFTHQGADFESGSAASLGTKWRATPAERAQIDQDVMKIKNWSLENKRPIFLGEFGTYYKVDSLSRALYTEYLATQFTQSGFSWAIWNFSSDFGIMNDTTEKWRTYLTQALLHPGHNAYLDSVLSVSKKIDVSVFVDIADFEDSIAALPHSARKWLMKQNRPLDSSAADWYTYFSDSSELTAPDGTRLLRYDQVGKDKQPANFHLAIGDWGYSGKGLHVKTKLAGGNYPFAGFGAGILGGYDSTFVDLTKLTAIQFRAKGRGEWNLQIISDSVSSDTVENWGQMGFQFTLKKEWENFIYPIDFFVPKPFSKQAKQKLKWEDVRKKIISLEFMNGQSYGPSPKDSLEIWLDDIRLIGVSDSDFYGSAVSKRSALLSR